MTSPPASPATDPTDDARLTVLYHYCRLQLPSVGLTEAGFRDQFERTYALSAAKADPSAPFSRAAYLDGLYVLDWLVCVGCLTGAEAAWDLLFRARTGRSDTLLVDALRGRACRLYPRDEEKQESTVTEFWSCLLVPETDAGTPILARFDGQRPLAPWLIRVFQNWQLSKLRRHSGVTSLPDDDIAMPLPSGPATEDHWREAFAAAGRAWLAEIPDGERLILGLRWRYRMSQREVAHLLGVHEGTISRQTDKLRDKALDAIGSRLIDAGWDGDNLRDYVQSEMGSLLLDEPSLSGDRLARLLGDRGKELPAG